jgi:surface protein
MFDSADKISANISSWDVSGVTDVSGMFYDASVFIRVSELN